MTTPRCSLLGGLALTALLAGSSLAPLAADDRDLLRTTSADPYMFIIFDVSGSMNWTPRCTQAQFDANICDYLCPSGDCTPRRMGDDPASKFVQAKEALHEVISTVANVNFGFATYNQDSLGAYYKHWLYRTTTQGVQLGAETLYWPPAIGSQETLGQDFGCDTGSNDYEVSCYGTDPADHNDAWEVERALRRPKLGTNGTETPYVYVRTPSNNRYRVRYRLLTGSLGSNSITVEYRSERCTAWNTDNSGCSSVSGTNVRTRTVTLDVIGDFLHWENTQSGGRADGRSWMVSKQDTTSGNTCNGWDSNYDSSSDDLSGYNTKYTTTTGDPRGSRFDLGDVIPLDWENNNRHLVLERLAPNGTSFGQASYFSNTPYGSPSVVRLTNVAHRPLLATGSTPIGASMNNFQSWYQGTNSSPGFADIAAAQDPDWSCRRKYLLIVTDGDETCNGNPCTEAAELFNGETMRTYVIAYGVEGASGNQLDCIAENGGTGEPIYPQNKQELVAALTAIFGEIQEETRAFASAAVPSVQADVNDKLYVSRFVPFNGESIWPGSLDAYLKPLPLTEDDQPDDARSCEKLDLTARCHLWDVREEVFEQAPDGADIAGGNYKIGSAVDERRILYASRLPATAVPATLRAFEPPSAAPGACGGYGATGCDRWWDLFEGFGLDSTASVTDRRDKTLKIFQKVLVQKSLTPDGSTAPIKFVMGDFFHSDPLYVDRPSDFEAYARDLFGYRAYSKSSEFRRKMLLVGANDGMLHAFDAGTWDVDKKGFTNGTGRELFAVMPRLAMPMVREQGLGDDQVFSMDAPVRLGDAFIDPAHGGTPTADQREWRTVVVAGMREGGSMFPSQDWASRLVNVPDRKARNGYIAVDITMPDDLNQPDPERPPITSTPILPNCLDLDGAALCGAYGFPKLLWEFGDHNPAFRDELPSNQASLDEDLNGYPDLGDTWSAPILGRILVTVGGTTQSREVAVFGGGMDTPDRTGVRGNWIYMVDVETGQAIYKRQVSGSVPAEIAVQDRDNNAYIDTLYFGTTEGTVYKVDVSTARPLETVSVRDLAGRILTVQRVTAAAWSPFPVFQAGPSGNPAPIFYAPTVFYLTTRGQYVIAFGTGDRENLWSEIYGAARFYVVADNTWTRAKYLAGTLPLTEASLTGLNPDTAGNQGDLVSTGGWYFTLGDDERVTTPAAGLVGLLTFTSFNPVVDFIGSGSDAVCARTGGSRIFVVGANSGNPLMATNPNEGDEGVVRYREIRDFTTPPYLDQGQTQNESNEDEEPEPWDQSQKEIFEELKKSFPEGTRFGNYYYQLVQRTSRNVDIPSIPIPIGIGVSNWKEF